MQDLFSGTTAEVRDYQVRTCDAVSRLLLGDDPVHSVLINSPTGSGKTVMGLALARLGKSLGKKVGWTAMRRNLLKQTVRMGSEFGFGLEDMTMVSMFERDPPSDIDWLIVDEAQHDATASMARLHSVANPERVIGLSATPYRTDRAKLSFDKTVKAAGIQELIDLGHLSQYDHYTIGSWTPEEVVRTYLMDPAGWGRSVMFFLTMQECRAAERALAAAKVACEVVWSGSDREAQIDRVRRGETEVAISMSLLAEGLDLEELQTVFVRPSQRGPTLQMAGRVLRVLDGSGPKRIVQCGDTKYPFLRAARARQSYSLFDGRFLSMTPNGNVEKMSKLCLDKLVSSASPKMPNFIVEAGRSRAILQGRRARRGSRSSRRDP